MYLHRFFQRRYVHPGQLSDITPQRMIASGIKEDTMKKYLSVFLVLVMLVGLVPTAQARNATTTIMMYMCGTDLQSDCINDLYEMCNADASENINIVVLAGGASEWDDSDLTPNRLNYFTIRNGGFYDMTDWGKASMGSSATLEKFVSTAYRAYPADRYMLVLWNHGGGSADGVCFDEVFNGDGLNLQEINQALYNVWKADNNFHLDIMGCDACLMGSYEMAVLASYYADYYIASEELEPWTGWYYTPWLDALAKEPNMSNLDLGKAMVDSYAKGVKMEGAQEYTTLSFINTATLSALNSDMELLASFLEQALENGQLATIRRSLSRMYRYGTYYSADGTWDMYDLGDILDLCEQFAPNTTADARRHLKNVVAYSYASRDLPAACGLSIYVPNKSSSYFYEDVLDGYSVGKYYPNQVDFAYGLSTMMNGGSYSFQASRPASADVSTVGSTAFSFGSGSFGFIPGGSYNAESSSGGSTGSAPSSSGQSSGTFSGGASGFIPGSSNQSGNASSGGASSFIPGSSGQSGSTSTGGASSFIPGSSGQSGSTFSGSVSSFIPGSAGAAAAASVVTEDSLAFSLALSQDAIDNLDYVEGALFMDLSDEEGIYLLDLGYMQNSWVDWSSNTVYSTFDGSWPTLGDQLVVMYDQSKNEVSRRSLIPVTVNGEETYLVVSFEGDSTTGRILGYNDGVDKNGLPIRRVTPLVEGDEIIPQYTLYYCGWDDDEDDMEEMTFEGDAFAWEAGMEVVYGNLMDEEEPADFQFAFYLNDIFGEFEMSDFFPFTM